MRLRHSKYGVSIFMKISFLFILLFQISATFVESEQCAILVERIRLYDISWLKEQKTLETLFWNFTQAFLVH